MDSEAGLLHRGDFLCAQPLRQEATSDTARALTRVTVPATCADPWATFLAKVQSHCGDVPADPPPNEPDPSACARWTTASVPR